MPRSGLPTTPSALVIAHPGHELRVHHWMELARPAVFILTDGSGGSRGSRVHRSREVVRQAGAVEGLVFGRFTDRELYVALSGLHTDIFVSLAHELAEAFIGGGIGYVAGDAIEDYNTGHDVCRGVIDAAVALTSARGVAVANYEFPLIAAPDACPDAARDTALWLALDTAALDRKIQAAQRYEELRDEVAGALERYGRDAFAIEGLWPRGATAHRTSDTEPFYETYGRQQAAAGLYPEVITRREHIQPVLEALARLGAPPCAG